MEAELERIGKKKWIEFTMVYEVAEPCLAKLLKNGPVPLLDIRLDAMQRGIPQIVVKRARTKLGVVSVRLGGEWHWALRPPAIILRLDAKKGGDDEGDGPKAA